MGPEMVLVEAGRFMMGSPEDEEGRFEREGPQREITIVRPFAIARCETTVGEFRRFVEETGYETEAESGEGCYTWNDDFSGGVQRQELNWRNPGFSQTDDHPVVCISWNDAVAYAGWLSRRTGVTYRLPTEAEWEYAARAGTDTSRFWGTDADVGCEFANAADQAFEQQFPDWPYEIMNCDDGAVFTAPAGSYRRNSLGLSDMLGNAWEWVQDCYTEDLTAVPENGSSYNGTDSAVCADRVVRGGGWFDRPAWVRSAGRDRNRARDADIDTGFRLARAL